MLMLRKRHIQQKWRVAIGVVAALSVPCVIGAYTSTVTSPSRQVTKSDMAVPEPPLTKPGDQKLSVVETPALPQPASCTTSAKKRAGLSTARAPQLKKLAQYEAVCGSGVISRLSFFVPTPTTTKEAISYGADVSAKLRDFAAHGIQPLVFFEPTSAGGKISLTAYQSGAYNTALDTYFKAIKQAGITDAMMGTWVPLPEGNLPEWTSVRPDVFAACVTKAVTHQKKYFPASKASIMLDTMTYTTPGNYDNGRVVSLLPYVKNIRAGLIDSFGLQGFPWSPPATEKGASNGRPRDYLRIDLAAEAARALKVKYIWLNTGTFATAYANQKGRVVASPAQRLSLLAEVVSEVKLLQAQKFTVMVHLFAEDKSSSAEGINWAYWQGSNYVGSPSTYVFKTFAHELQQVGAGLWLFDTTE